MAKFICIFALLFTSWSSFALSCHQRWQAVLKDHSIKMEYRSLVDLCDGELRTALQKLISHNIDLGYWKARHLMFSNIDNDNGIVCGVYTGQCIKALDIPPRTIMNCEHSWPQSRGAVGIAKSDLHHLFPVIAHVNSRRSNHPFCNVAVIKTEEDGSYLGESVEGTRCFEPRPEHKGDVARALFYFAIRYGKKIDQEQEHYLREWFAQDGVSMKERLRNDKIEQLQGNRNPFVDFPFLLTFIADF